MGPIYIKIFFKYDRRIEILLSIITLLNVKFYNTLTFINNTMLRNMGSERVKINVKLNSKFVFIKAVHVLVSTSRDLPIRSFDYRYVNFPKTTCKKHFVMTLRTKSGTRAEILSNTARISLLK